MSYRSRYKYRQPIFKTERRENSPKRFDVRGFLKDEFFNCDDIIFKRIADLYCDLYGVSAHNYMVRTYYSWKYGHVGISGQTFARILECVPRFLSDEKRFFILKCEVVYFLDKLHYDQQLKVKQATLADIKKLFEAYNNEIEKFDKSNLPWFVEKGVFTEAELEQFLSACKYAIRKRLNLAYTQVFNDLTLIKSKLNQFGLQRYLGTYKIDFLNTIIDVDTIQTFHISSFTVNNLETKFEGLLKQFAERYILDELIKLDYADKSGKGTAYIKSQDLDTLFSYYKQAADSKNQLKIASTFDGEGGVFKISLTYTSFQKALEKVSIASLKILGLAICELLFLYLWFGMHSSWGFLLGFFGGLWIASLVFQEIMTINESIIEYKNNG